MEMVDAKEVEASMAVEDNGTAMLWKEKKRRRVSFAHTDTVHVIPRNQTPTLVPNAHPPSSIHKTSVPSELSLSGVPASQPAIQRLSTAVSDLHSGSLAHENSADFSQFTSDMDTNHGSWTDEDSTSRRNSFDGLKDDGGCFVHLGHISGLEDDDSIVNDVMNDDMTMDASTLSRNLSYYLKSVTKSDSQQTGPLRQVVSHVNANDMDSQHDDDSMALTKPGAPHWGLVYPQDVVLHADGDESDMSLATATVSNTMLPVRNLKDLLLDQTEHTITRQQSRDVSTGKKSESSSQSHSHSKHGHSDPQSSDSGRLGFPLSKKEVIVENVEESLHADSDQSDISLATGTFFNTTTFVCNLKDLLSDQTDHTMTRKLSREVSTGKKPESSNFGSDSIRSHSHSEHGQSDSQSSGLDFPSSKNEAIVKIAEDVSLHADDDQSDMSLATGTIFNTTTFVCNLKDLLMDQTDHTVTRKQSREVVLTCKKLESCTFGPDSIQSHSHSKHGHSDSKSLDCGGLVPLASSRKDVIVGNAQKASSVKADQFFFMRDPMRSKSTDADFAANKEVIEDKQDYEVSTQGIRMAKVSVGVGISRAFGKDPCTKGARCLEDILHCIKGTTLHGEDHDGKEDMVPMLPMKLQTLGDYLQFSCSVQLQMDWLREHVQELEAKLQTAMKRNAELKSSNIFVQKLLEEATLTFKTKFASMHSLAKKRWLLWKMKSERQILAWLQESKDNLIKEYEAVYGKGQQVLHLKESYTQLVLHHRYQDACERLRISKDKWNKMQTLLQSIASVYGPKVPSAADSSEISFERNLEAVIRRLIFTNSLLRQQQVMQSTLKSNGRKSLIDFSLDGMFLQSFQFEGGSPLAQVESLRTLHPKAIEMTFPCMDASLAFQYVSCDLQSIALVQMQHLYQIIQHTNYLLGCLMDVLKEIRYCRRNFRICCKFQMQKDELVLNISFLRCVSGLTVTLMFDMVCLREGMYPCDMKPADIQIETYACPSNSSIIQKEVLAQIANIQPGFAKLHRICSCVENFMSTVKDKD